MNDSTHLLIEGKLHDLGDGFIVQFTVAVMKPELPALPRLHQLGAAQFSIVVPGD